MTTLRNVRTLTRYMAWANDRIYDAVASLPEGEATKPRRSVFKNIVRTLNHVYVIDLIFQAHLQGRERKVLFTFVGGGEGTMTCAEIALHLANRTSYHRGPREFSRRGGGNLPCWSPPHSHRVHTSGADLWAPGNPSRSNPCLANSTRSAGS